MKTLQKILIVILSIITIDSYAQKQAELNVKNVMKLVQAKKVDYIVKTNENYGFKNYFIDIKGFTFKSENNIFSISKGRKKVAIAFESTKEWREEEENGATTNVIDYLDITGRLLVEVVRPENELENYISIGAPENICFFITDYKNKINDELVVTY